MECVSVDDFVKSEDQRNFEQRRIVVFEGYAIYVEDCYRELR